MAHLLGGSASVSGCPRHRCCILISLTSCACRVSPSRSMTMIFVFLISRASLVDANATGAPRHRQCQLSTFPLSVSPPLFSFAPVVFSRRLFFSPFTSTQRRSHRLYIFTASHLPLCRGGHFQSVASVCLWKCGRRTAGENYDGGKHGIWRTKRG